MTNTADMNSYEALYARMQAIVGRLEAGELPLEEALALYEEGVAVAATCQRLLDAAELRIQELNVGPGARPNLWED